MRISDADTQDIIARYESLEPMVDIAKRYKVTRCRIYQILKAHGVDTTKKKCQLTCPSCGETFFRTKAKVRNNKTVNYCSVECYTAGLEANRIGILSRQGQRVGRREVAKHFDLQEGNVVHHVDGNNLNNHITNLVVFATQSDHLRYHRSASTTPIWSSAQH